jgi:integrase
MARWAASRRPPLCDAGALGAWRNLPEIARNRDPLIPSPAEWAQVVRELEREPSPRDTAEGRARTAANARGVAVLVAVAVQTGLRVDELRHLRAEDIGADVVSVRAWGEWRPKNREERSVPVPPAVADLARELAAWRVRAVGLNGEKLALGGHWIEARITPAWERAGLPGEAPGMHDARRTFATEMSRRPGVSLRDVQRLLGHGDIATTQRYLGRYRSDADRPAVDMGLASVLSSSGAAPVLPLRRRG